MTWSEEAQWRDVRFAPGERIVVLRFVEDPGEGIIEDWSPELRDRLIPLGNPVRVTFDCWRQFGGTLGYDITALGGEPFVRSRYNRSDPDGCLQRRTEPSPSFGIGNTVTLLPGA